MKERKIPIFCGFLSVALYFIFFLAIKSTFFPNVHLNSIGTYDYLSLLYLKISYVFLFLKPIVFDNYDYPFPFNITNIIIPLIICVSIVWSFAITIYPDLKDLKNRIYASLSFSSFLVLVGLFICVFAITNNVLDFSQTYSITRYNLIEQLSIIASKFIAYSGFCYILLIITEIVNNLLSKLPSLGKISIKLQAINKSKLSTLAKWFSYFCIITVSILILLLNILKSEVYMQKVGDLNIPRGEHSSIELKDGRVLIVGGDNKNKNERKFDYKKEYLTEIEAFNPQTLKFDIVGKLAESRLSPSLIELSNGNIMIIGGMIPGGFDAFRSSVEMFIPKINKIVPAGNLSFALNRSVSAINKFGQVITVGGDYRLRDAKYKTPIVIDVYNFDKKTFERKAIANNYYSGSASDIPLSVKALSDGKFIIIGGLIDEKNTVGLFDPKTNQFSLRTVKNYTQDNRFSGIINIDNQDNILLSPDLTVITYKNGEFEFKSRINFMDRGFEIMHFDAFRPVPYVANKIFICNSSIHSGPPGMYTIDLTTGKKSAVKHMNYDHGSGYYSGNIIVLKNGNLLITGGNNGVGFEDESINGAEIYKMEQ